jgi:UDP-GlcNAc:undecaprenyl-phosphate GlcNAc-1-phosphate transferase
MPYLTAALATFVLSATLTWATTRVGRSRGWLQMPRPDRTHREPTVLFGGVAIFIALMAGLLTFSPLTRPLIGLCLVAAGMFALGLADDLRDLKPQTKLVAQIAAGLLLYQFDFHFNSSLPWLLDLAVVVIWVVGLTNAMNLLDNMNGLSAGIAVIAVAFRWLFYVGDGNVEGATHSAVFFGAVLGFLIFNFPRASIFMGDAGSLVIGFCLAALNLTSAESYSRGLISVLVFPVLVLAIPIFDTALVSVVRTVSGRAVSQGGRDHTSHRLVAVGLSETTAVLILYGISIAGGAIAFALYQIEFSYIWFLGVLLAMALLLFGVFLSSVKIYPEDRLPPGVAAPDRSLRLVADFRFKRVVLWVLVDTLTIFVAWYATFLVRYGHTPAWPAELALFTSSAPIAVIAMLVGLALRGLYRTDWVHFSVHEIRAIVTGTAAGLSVAFVALVWLGHEAGRRPGLAAVAFGSTVLMLAGSRLFVRTLADVLPRQAVNRQRILIYGAGQGGQLALRELRSNDAWAMEAVGFLDDDPSRRGMTLHGVPVLGGVKALSKFLDDGRVDGVLVSTRKLTPAREEDLARRLRETEVKLYRLQIDMVEVEGDTVPVAKEVGTVVQQPRDDGRPRVA